MLVTSRVPMAVSPRFIPVDRRLSIALFALIVGVAGCDGVITTPKPDPTPLTNPNPYACPRIDPSQGACSGVHFLQASLTCGGSGKLSIAINTAAGGAQRFTVGLQNGSRFSGKLITPDPGCWIKDGAMMAIVFGLTYTGDQGLETGTTTQCIVQSKVDFTNFAFDPLDVGSIPGAESAAKNQVHQAIDKAVINTLFAPQGGTPLPGRCARWRQMP